MELRLPSRNSTPTLKGAIMKITERLTPAAFRASILVSILLVACSSMYSAMAETPAKMNDGVLTGNNGMTLYIFDKDTDGKSACNGKCAENWPPLVADGSASGDFSVITRDDGKKQYAYKGKPLYFWAKDQKPGDKTGDGVNNVWHVAK
jgi:predicted lipoprotein with Yx(FWY)xxD motif